MPEFSRNAAVDTTAFAACFAASFILVAPVQAATFGSAFIDSVAGDAMPTYQPLADGETEVLSRIGASYDGSYSPTTGDGPDELPANSHVQARKLSNTLSVPENEGQDAVPMSRLAVHMFQLLASHEIAKSPTNHTESIDIPLQPGDEAYFGNLNPLGMSRSATTGEPTREQVNDVTSAFDGSTVYGSTTARKEMLWETDGDGNPTGYLLTSKTDGIYEPSDDDDTALPGLPRHMVWQGPMQVPRAMAGDARADENPTLQALHQLFMLEHNRIAALIWEDCADQGAACSGEEVFNAARYLVAETQKQIFYQELLPLFLGTDEFETLLPDASVLDGVEGAINEFTAAAGRIGHTQVPETIRLATREDGYQREVTLSDCFFDRGCLGNATLEEILYGAAQQQAEPVDLMVTDSLRNGLTPGFMANRNIDLIATNINRGRDHGLPGYLAMREALGFDPVTTLEELLGLLPQSVLDAYQITEDNFLDTQIDLMVGLFAELRNPSDYLGDTGKALWALQFLSLQDDGMEFVLANASGWEFPVATSSMPAADFMKGQTMANLLANHLGGWASSFSTPFTAPVPVPHSTLFLLGALGCLVPFRRRAVHSANRS